VKNIIITGPSRSGKSTLARKINKEFGHSIIRLDGFAWAFNFDFPQVGCSYKNSVAENASIITKFLLRYVEVWASPEHEAYYVAEGVYIDYNQFFDKFKSLKNPQSFEAPDDLFLIGLHYNGSSADDLYMNMRKYDVEGDWTFNRSEEKLRKHAEQCVEENTYHYEQFVKHGFTTYDVSSEREAVFAQIMKDISIKF